jgi:peroxiredoxin
LPVRDYTLQCIATMGGPDIGELAPDFSLRRGLDEYVRLRELRERGPVLLLFYVFDFGDY